MYGSPLAKQDASLLNGKASSRILLERKWSAGFKIKVPTGGATRLASSLPLLKRMLENQETSWFVNFSYLQFMNTFLTAQG